MRGDIELLKKKGWYDMRQTIKINRDQAGVLIQATFTRFQELNEKRNGFEYGSREYNRYTKEIHDLLDIQDEMCDFYCEG